MSEQRTEHHFLYHIFTRDKAEHPMPEDQVQSLLQLLTRLLQERQNRKELHP